MPLVGMYLMPQDCVYTTDLRLCRRNKMAYSLMAHSSERYVDTFQYGVLPQVWFEYKPDCLPLVAHSYFLIVCRKLLSSRVR